MADTTRTTWIALYEGHSEGEGVRLPLPGRYGHAESIGHGGMGEVWVVWDHLLEREVAMKVLAPSLWMDETARRRFETEARVLALLDHPDIVSIHDRGILGDGAPFYTMRRVRGLTLGERAADPIRARIGWWIRIAEAVAFAHSRGIVHRDLKPANVMIGPFGEVQVVDWGIAHALDTDEPILVGGSPGFMAPEQRAGRQPHPAADCYSLGRMLASIVEPGHELLSVVEAATQPDPDTRPDASELAGRVRSWLDGARRRERALEHVARAEALSVEMIARNDRAVSLCREAERHLGELPPEAPASAKHTAWALQDEARDERLAAALADARREHALGAALALDPELPEAHARMSAHHRAQLLAAEERGDPEAAIRHAERLRIHGVDADRAWLDRGGRVSLHTNPAGARVVAERLDYVNRRLVPVERRSLGSTPIVGSPLARGRWTLRVHHPDCEPMNYPVLIERETHWDGIPPGASASARIPLLPKGSLPPDHAYVAAGWFTSGGDPQALQALDARRLWVDGFILARRPVTNAQYVAFLNDLVNRGRVEEALARVGRIGGDRGSALHLRSGGRFTSVRPDDQPVVGLSGHDAAAYCAWLGPGWRLPDEQEWEKAARGVDRRPLPWGSENEPSWARRAASVKPPRLASVHELDLDVSPYGVLGMAGNTADWCGNGFESAGPEPGSRVVPCSHTIGKWAVRGGHYEAGAASSRVATRMAAEPERRLYATGVRPCRSVTPCAP